MKNSLENPMPIGDQDRARKQLKHGEMIYFLSGGWPADYHQSQAKYEETFGIYTPQITSVEEAKKLHATDKLYNESEQKGVLYPNKAA